MPVKNFADKLKFDFEDKKEHQRWSSTAQSTSHPDYKAQPSCTAYGAYNAYTAFSAYATQWHKC